VFVKLGIDCFAALVPLRPLKRGYPTSSPHTLVLRRAIDKTQRWCALPASTPRPPPYLTRVQAGQKSFVGSIDNGTTSSRFLIFDTAGHPLASHQLEFKQIHPQSGYVPRSKLSTPPSHY
jgi:hypothetical protein